MTDTLEIFGTEYSGVTGIKATDNNGNTKTYIRPDGTVTISSSGTTDVTAYASASVAGGTATPAASITATGATVSTSGSNTLTLSKTSVSNTPQVSAGYISSGTAGNSSVSLSATVNIRSSSDLTASTLTVTAPAGYYSNQATKTCSDANLVAGNIKSGTTIFGVTGSYSGGGSISTDTKTATASNYPTSLDFTGMKGEPKMFTVHLNAQVSSSGSTTYYYIVNITSHGTTTHGNCFRIGNTRRVDNITTGYSWSYSGTTLTITSNAGSRSASPGAFYSGSYELMYVY